MQIIDFFTIFHSECNESDRIYINKFKLGVGRTDYMTDDDLLAEDEKLENMRKVLSDEVAARKNAPLQYIWNLVNKKLHPWMGSVLISISRPIRHIFGRQWPV